MSPELSALRVRQKPEEIRTEELRSLFRLSPDLFAIVSTDGYFLRLNESWTRVLGWTTEELLSRTFYEFIHPDDRTATEDVIKKNIEMGKDKVEGFVNRYQTKSGEYRSLSWSGALSRSEGTIYCVARDITETIQRDVALRKSEERFRRLMDLAPVGIWESDERGRCIFVNLHCERILGEPSENLQGMAWGSVIHPEDRERIFSAWTKTVSQRSDFCEEFRFLTQQGKIVWALAQAVPFAGNQGGGFLGAFQDITERKEAERKLNANAAQLDRSNRELEQFATVASHDLQAPLRTISLYLQLLEVELAGHATENQRNYLGFALSGAQRLHGLVRALLNYASISQDVGKSESVDSNVVIRLVLEFLQERIVETGAQIYVETLPSVSGVGALVQQVFQNLIDNSLKYRNSRSLEIWVSASPRGSMVEFTVADNGNGVPERIRNKIFEMFYRGESQTRVPGSGIGLAHCKKIIELHGGSISVEDRPGGGSVFRFTLPAA